MVNLLSAIPAHVDNSCPTIAGVPLPCSARGVTNGDRMPCMETKWAASAANAIKLTVLYLTAALVLTVAVFAQGKTSATPSGFAILHCDEVVEGKVRLRIITVNTRPEAEAVLQKLKQGQSFSDLAKQYSTDDSTRSSGGFAGLISTGDMREEFRIGLKGIRAGDTTSIIALYAPVPIEKVSILKEPLLIEWSSLGSSMARQSDIDKRMAGLGDDGFSFRGFLGGANSGETLILKSFLLFVGDDAIDPIAHKGVPISRFTFWQEEAGTTLFPAGWRVSAAKPGESLFTSNGVFLIRVGSEIALPSDRFVVLGHVKMRNGRGIVKLEGLEMQPGIEIAH